MKNSMFLMLVLLHITSQPAQPSIAADAQVEDKAWHYERFNDRMREKYGLPLRNHTANRGNAEINEGRVGVVQSLLKIGVNSYRQDGHGKGSLQSVVCRGNTEIVRIHTRDTVAVEGFPMLGLANPNLKNVLGLTLLSNASKEGHIDHAQLLLQYGVGVNLRNGNGDTPLYFHDTAVKILVIKYGAGLQLILMGNEHGMMTYFTGRGAKVNQNNSQGSLLLHDVVDRDYLSKAPMAKEYGLDINSPDKQRMVYTGGLQMMTLLTEDGVRGQLIRTTKRRVGIDEDGVTAMHRMIPSRWRLPQRNHHDIVPLLLSCDTAVGNPVQYDNASRKKKGRDTTIVTPKCHDAHIGENERRITISEYEWHDAHRVEDKMPKLRYAHIDNWANEKLDVDLPNRYGVTPMQNELCAGNLQTMALCIKFGADVNYHDAYGLSLLHYACAKRDRKTVAFLIKHGAEVDKKNKWGETCLSNMICEGNVDMAGFLIASKANVNYQNQYRSTPYRSTPLRDAISSGTPIMTELLIAAGTRIDAIDIESCFGVLHKGFLTKTGITEREYSKNQFEENLTEDLRKHGLKKREKELFDTIEECCRGRLPVELSKLISKFGVMRNSKIKCIEMAAQTVIFGKPNEQ